MTRIPHQHWIPTAWPTSNRSVDPRALTQHERFHVDGSPHVLALLRAALAHQVRANGQDVRREAAGAKSVALSLARRPIDFGRFASKDFHDASHSPARFAKNDFRAVSATSDVFFRSRQGRRRAYGKRGRDRFATRYAAFRSRARTPIGRMQNPHHVGNDL